MVDPSSLEGDSRPIKGLGGATRRTKMDKGRTKVGMGRGQTRVTS